MSAYNFRFWLNLPFISATSATENSLLFVTGNIEHTQAGSAFFLEFLSVFRSDIRQTDNQKRIIQSRSLGKSVNPYLLVINKNLSPYALMNNFKHKRFCAIFSPRAFEVLVVVLARFKQAAMHHPSVCYILATANVNTPGLFMRNRIDTGYNRFSHAAFVLIKRVVVRVARGVTSTRATCAL